MRAARWSLPRRLTDWAFRARILPGTHHSLWGTK